MKNTILSLILTLPFTITHLMAKSIYDYNLKSARGKELKLSDFKGKILLVVNIATRCGYTGQLDDLEKLYKKYQAKGLVVLGVPSNDFGGQTPEKDQEVAKFCKLNYGVTFPLTSKTKVSGKNKSDFFNYVIKTSGGDEIGWNFEKFLFNKEGKLLKRYSSSEKPLGPNMDKAIKGLLN